MKPRLVYALFVVVVRAGQAEQWLRVTFDKRLARCCPDTRYGTYVWHEHRWAGRRWLATHTRLEDGTEYRDFLPWAELRDDDIHVRVYSAGQLLP